MMATHKLLSVDFPLSQLLQGADTRNWDFSRNRVLLNMYIKSSNKNILWLNFICSMTMNYSIFILCNKLTCAHQSHIFHFIMYYVSMRVTYPVTSEGMLH